MALKNSPDILIRSPTPTKSLSLTKPAQVLHVILIAWKGISIFVCTGNWQCEVIVKSAMKYATNTSVNMRNGITLSFSVFHASRTTFGTHFSRKFPQHFSQWRHLANPANKNCANKNSTPIFTMISHCWWAQPTKSHLFELIWAKGHLGSFEPTLYAIKPFGTLNTTQHRVLCMFETGNHLNWSSNQQIPSSKQHFCICNSLSLSAPSGKTIWNPLDRGFMR